MQPVAIMEAKRPLSHPNHWPSVCPEDEVHCFLKAIGNIQATLKNSTFPPQVHPCSPGFHKDKTPGDTGPASCAPSPTLARVPLPPPPLALARRTLPGSFPRFLVFPPKPFA